MGRSGNPAHRGFKGTGIKVEAAQRHHSEMSDPGPGRHLWTMLGMWRVDPSKGQEQMILDVENLLTIEGPGCFKCEREYSAVLDAQPCLGSMR